MQGLAQAFEPFAALAPLHVSEFARGAWVAASLEYAARMQRMEGSVSERLRQEFQSSIIPSLAAAVSSSGGQALGLMAQPHQVKPDLGSIET